MGKLTSEPGTISGLKELIMRRRMSVALVIRNNLVREGLHRLLENAWTVISKSSPLDLLEAGNPTSDIILLSEVYVADEDCSVLSEVRVHNPRAKVVLIGHRFTDLQHLANVVNAGAWGYISSETPFSSLRAQIELVALGDKVFPAELIGALAATRSVDTESDLVSALTEHERQVLSGMGYGLPTKDIATSTGITETRVKLVTKALFRKLRVKNRTQAALMAREHGWLSVQDKVGACLKARKAQKAAPSGSWWGAA